MTLLGKQVMMTQLALAASPLFYGGDLQMSNDEDIALVTEPHMLACNRNGVVGKRIYHQRHIDIRRALNKQDQKHGWLGVFNREATEGTRIVTLRPEDMGFENGEFPRMYDIWNQKELQPENGVLTLEFPAYGVYFIEY